MSYITTYTRNHFNPVHPEAEKIDILYAACNLTDEHYAELTGMLAEKKEQV